MFPPPSAEENDVIRDVCGLGSECPASERLWCCDLTSRAQLLGSEPSLISAQNWEEVTGC